MSYRMLLIEDNAELAKLLKMHLQDLQYDVDLADHGKLGLAKAETGHYDLIVLDIMLPGMDGLEICRHIRSQPGYVPILMLTARSSELDRVLGLEIGADDYVTKPFSIPEFLARAKALLRRAEKMKAPSSDKVPAVIHSGGLTIEAGKRQVIVDGRQVELTAKEFDLLLHFARHPGRVFTREELLEAVWGYSYEGYEHTVNSHINRLRGKIEQDPARPRYVLTAWGVGYKFAEAES